MQNRKGFKMNDKDLIISLNVEPKRIFEKIKELKIFKIQFLDMQNINYVVNL
jgi:hypothetical protein